MADYADGSIIIDTELDTKGFQAQSNEMQRAMKSLSTKVQGLGPAFQKAMSGNASSVSSFSDKASALQNVIADLQQRMVQLAKVSIKTDDYKYLESEIEKTDKSLEKMQDRMEKLNALGADKDSMSYKSLQYDIEQAKDNLKGLIAEKERLEQSGESHIAGVETDAYRQLEDQLNACNQQLASMQNRTRQTNSFFGKLRSGIASAFTSAVPRLLLGDLQRLADLGKQVGNAFATIGKKSALGFAKAVTGIGSFRKQTKLANASTAALVKRLTGLWTMVKRRLVRSFITDIIRGAKEGIENLARYSKSFNATMSGFKTASLQLKNSFATAFAPILSTVIPILTKLLNIMSAVITRIGMLFAALRGQKSFTKAITVQQDYAASLDKSAKSSKGASKAAKQYTSSIDELNVISENSSGSGGGSGADVSNMFEDVPIESGIGKFAKTIQELFSQGRYADIGKLIGEQINAGVKKIDSFINWKRVGSKLTKHITAFCEIFNGLADGIDFDSIGTTVAHGLNTIINSVYLILTRINWENLGKKLSDSANGLFRELDFTKFGSTIAQFFNARLNAIYGVITNFDWKQAGKKLGQTINSLAKQINWKRCGQTFGKLLTNILNFAIEGLNSVDWSALGSQIASMINGVDAGEMLRSLAKLLNSFVHDAFTLGERIMADVDWGSLGRGIADFVNEIDLVQIIGDFAKFISTFWKSAFTLVSDFIKGVDWADLVDKLWNSLIAYLKSYDFEGVITTMFDLLGAAIGGLTSIVFSLAEHIWNALKQAWESVKSYFGDYFDQFGGNIIEGLLMGILNAIANIATWIYDHIFTPFINGFKNAFGIHSPSTVMQQQGGFIIQGLLNGITAAWKRITSFFSNAVGSVIGWTQQAFKSIKDTVSSGWTSVKTWTESTLRGIGSTVSNGWNSVKTTTSNAWNRIRSSLSSSLNSIWSNVSSTFTNLGRNAYTWGSDICANISNGIHGAIGWVSSAARNVARSIRGFLGFSEPEEGPLSDFHTYMPDMLDLMAKGIRDNTDKATSAASDVAQAISSEIQNGDYAVNSVAADVSVDASMNSFADRITDGFSRLISRLQAIADGVTFAVPVVAEGTAVPHGTRAGNFTPRFSGYGDDSEDKNSFIEAVALGVYQAVMQALTSTDDGGQPVNIIMNLDGEKIYQNQQKIARRHGYNFGMGAFSNG